jgi:hypothetical protein
MGVKIPVGACLIGISSEGKTAVEVGIPIIKNAPAPLKPISPQAEVSAFVEP